MRFDVYGRFVVEVEREAGTWVVWRVGRDGKRSRADNVPLLPDTPESDLAAVLEDVFHEYGAPGRALVRLDEQGSRPEERDGDGRG